MYMITMDTREASAHSAEDTIMERREQSASKREGDGGGGAEERACCSRVCMSIHDK